MEILSKGDAQRTREYVEQVPLKFIFQIGFGASLELKWRAERIWQAWLSGKGTPPSFPWEEKIQGLLRKRPLFYDEGQMGYREFRSLEEIRSVHRDLDKIESIQNISYQRKGCEG